MVPTVPTIDTLDQWVRIVGYPSACVVIWRMSKMWNAASKKWADMHETTDATKDIVEKIQGNHLAHLQEGIGTLVEANKTQVELLHSIDKGIATLNATLVERGRRQA